MEQALHRYAPDTGWQPSLNPTLDGEKTLLLAFCSPELSLIQPGLDELLACYPSAQCIGCSTAGEILGTEISDHSITAAIVRFDNISIRTASSNLESAEQSANAGISLAEALMQPSQTDDPQVDPMHQDQSLRAVLVLSEGIEVNGSELIKGLNQSLPSGVVVTGGLAGDGEQFAKTWVLQQGKIRSGVVAAVGLYGESLLIGHGSRGGWDLLGPEREVTCSRDNVLVELDGQPALETYKRYLGERASGLPATGLLFPLAIHDPDAPDELKVRTILAVDEQAQSITFAGDIPQGKKVRLMRANFDRLIDGAGNAAEDMMKSFESASEVLCVVISCVGRRMVLGERSEEELEAVREFLPAHAGMLGYYSYGEISPLANGRCDLHNQTMTLTLIGEDRR